MKTLLKLLAGIVMLILVGAAVLVLNDRSLRKSVAETRRTLREQGFKTDVAEFDFTITPEFQRREQALTNAFGGWSVMHQTNFVRREFLQSGEPNLMVVISPDTAIPVWKQNQIADQDGVNQGPILREILIEDAA